MFQHEKIIDQLNEWDLIDSAGYSIPATQIKPRIKPVYPIELALFNSFRAKTP